MSKTLYDPKDNSFAEGAASKLLRMDHDTVDTVKLFMERNARFVTANQLRNVYARIRAFDGNAEKQREQLPMLRVKLAYIKGKSDRRSRGFHALLDLLDEMIQQIKDAPEQLPELKRFFEAVLAYHKYYENVKPNRR